MTGQGERMPRRGLALTVLIVNQLLAGAGVATGMALAAILTADLTDTVAMGGLAQSSSVLGAAIVAIPLARLAVRAGRHVALATGYALAFGGAVLVVTAATSGMPALVFLGLAAFGAASAAGLQARFAGTEVAAPGFEARSMSLVLWATTIGSVAGPLLSESGDEFGQALGLPPLVGPFVFSAVAFALSALLVGTLLRTPRAGHLAVDPSAPAADEPSAPPDVGDPAVALDASAVASRGASPAKVGAWSALTVALRNPRALVAFLAIVCSHTVMVGVMAVSYTHLTLPTN